MKYHSISKTIAAVLRDDGQQGTARPRALFEFIAAFRWPNSRGIQRIASQIYLVKYISERYGSNQAASAAALLAEIDFRRFISDVLSDELLDFSFTITRPKESNDRRVADIVRFLLTWKPNSGESVRKKASIQKAHYFVSDNRGYGWESGISLRAFKDLWIQNKATASLTFVNEYYFNRRLLLDPAKSTFSDMVSDLLSDQAGLRGFFENAMFVQRHLQQVLDRRAWEGVPIIAFPDFLEPKPILLRQPDKKMHEIMRGYRN